MLTLMLSILGFLIIVVIFTSTTVSTIIEIFTITTTTDTPISGTHSADFLNGFVYGRMKIDAS
jgi:hypothetical protein